MELAKVIASKNPDVIELLTCTMMGDATDADLFMAESVEQTEIIYKPNQLEAVAAFFEK